jgi:hypothetical protein
MQRRSFLTAAAAATVSTLESRADAAPPASSKSAYLHFRYYYMRAGSQTERTNAYLKDVYLPAANRAGLGPVGFFSALVSANAPFTLAITSFPSLAALENLHDPFAGNAEFRKGWKEYNAAAGYERLESSLLRAFDAFPAIEAGASDLKRPARVFELRTYQGLTEDGSLRKKKMFEGGEIAIFQRLKMTPVLFGQSIVGPNQPNNTYMLAFDDLAARERLWKDFSADPEWQKMRATPGMDNSELNANTTNTLLQPRAFSPVR